MEKLNKLIKKYHSSGGRNLIYNVPFEVMDEAGDNVIKIYSPDHLRNVRNGRLDDYIAISPMGMNMSSANSTHKTSEYK